jgi:hypothetical protein
MWLPFAGNLAIAAFSAAMCAQAVALADFTRAIVLICVLAFAISSALACAVVASGK